MKITDLTVLQLGRRIAAGEIGIREALEASLDVISEQEERLHCFLTVDREKAYLRAGELQKELADGIRLSPLMGVPFAVKDNLCTKGIRTSAGSAILESFVPGYSATAVDRLEKAGAILIGKTNMDEFAMGSTTETSYFGGTMNPVSEGFVPGGSSGGSAAAVAARECFFALGSDTGGSVRQPASHCGVIGFKPSYGMVSRYGLLAYCSSMDQIGTLTKDVNDSAAVMQIIAGADEKDSTCFSGENNAFGTMCDEAAAGTYGGESVDLRGIRVGIPSELLAGGTQKEVRETVRSAAKALEEMGAVVEEIRLGITDWIVPAYYTIACAEASSNLERYDGVKYGLRVKEEKLHELYCKTRSEGFGAEVKRRLLLGTFVLSEGFYDAYYLRALRVRRLIKETLDQVFTEYQVLLCPVAPTAAPRLGECLRDPIRNYMADVDTAFANLAGLPAISVPFGRDDRGLPIGVQLVAGAFQDGRLLQIAKVFTGDGRLLQNANALRGEGRENA